MRLGCDVHCGVSDDEQGGGKSGHARTVSSSSWRTTCCIGILVLLLMWSFVSEETATMVLRSNAAPSSYNVPSCRGAWAARQPFCDRVDAIVLIMSGPSYALTTVGEFTLKSITQQAFEAFPTIPLFIITDQAMCLQSVPLIRDNPRVHLLQVDMDVHANEHTQQQSKRADTGEGEDGSSGPYPHRSPIASLRYKMLKTRIFEVLPATIEIGRNEDVKAGGAGVLAGSGATGSNVRRLDRVLYLDSDIVLTKLFPSWLQRLPSIFGDSNELDSHLHDISGDSGDSGIMDRADFSLTPPTRLSRPTAKTPDAMGRSTSVSSSSPPDADKNLTITSSFVSRKRDSGSDSGSGSGSRTKPACVLGLLHERAWVANNVQTGSLTLTLALALTLTPTLTLTLTPTLTLTHRYLVFASAPVGGMFVPVERPFTIWRIRLRPGCL